MSTSVEKYPRMPYVHLPRDCYREVFVPLSQAIPTLSGGVICSDLQYLSWLAEKLSQAQEYINKVASELSNRDPKKRLHTQLEVDRSQ